MRCDLFVQKSYFCPLSWAGGFILGGRRGGGGGFPRSGHMLAITAAQEMPKGVCVHGLREEATSIDPPAYVKGYDEKSFLANVSRPLDTSELVRCDGGTALKQNPRIERRGFVSSCVCRYSTSDYVGQICAERAGGGGPLPSSFRFPFPFSCCRAYAEEEKKAAKKGYPVRRRVGVMLDRRAPKRR